ncbi:response regulator [Paracoccus sp. T5]|uniref:response regulator n=1 Tax=Paracoccus sp. T5 TaxID=3402161 RepID=UPI003AE728C3
MSLIGRKRPIICQVTGSPLPDEATPDAATCILIVEDEPIVAIDLQCVFEDHGYIVLGPARSVSMAFRLLNSRRPDLALLDANLRGQPVTPVAERLLSHGIPYFLSSAYETSQLQVDEVLANVENVRKPAQSSSLLAAARRALDGA